jgi:hypothetical protein
MPLARGVVFATTAASALCLRCLRVSHPLVN